MKNCRLAVVEDYPIIFMMGYDEWGEGLSEEEYLQLCFNSKKYKKGNWWVLEDNSKIVSSLITYNLGNKYFGIGSVATTLNHRNKGHASKLVRHVTNYLKVDAKGIFLYSDISPLFYEKFGYSELPQKYQKFEKTKCMYLKQLVKGVINKSSFIPPEYF